MCGVPLATRAKPVGTFEFIVSAPGDQTDPAIDGQYVVYAGPGPAGDGLDIFLHDIQFGTTRTIAGGPGDQDSPGVHSSAVVYRDAAGIFIESWPTGQILRAPPAGGDGAVSNPVVHSAVAAWEQRSAATGLDIVVSRYRAGVPSYVLRAPGDLDPVGDQHSPAVFDGLVAYVDEARGGSVWLHDSGRGPSDWTLICGGPSTGVSIGYDGTRYVFAVSRVAGATGEDIEIYDRAGALLAALPGAGPQRNPHVAGGWVAFDDYSGVNSQVAVWRWQTPPGEAELVFVPHPTDTQQRLNDISLALTDEVRVVFEDSASVATGRDIALYRLPINPIVYDSQTNGWPIASAPVKRADCADPSAVPLATLDLLRTTGSPNLGSVPFTAVPLPGRSELPVLVCVHAEHVSAAWVLLGADAAATPDDFDPSVADLSIPAQVKGGPARVSARIEGEPGSRLVVRVLADPARADPCQSGTDDVGHSDEGEYQGREDRDGHGNGHRTRIEAREGCPGGSGATAVAQRRPRVELSSGAASGGCGGGPGALPSLAFLVLLVVRRRLRD